MKKWNEIIIESSNDEKVFNDLLTDLAGLLHKKGSSYSPDAVSMYREKIKKLGSKLGLSNSDIDEKIEDFYKKHK